MKKKDIFIISAVFLYTILLLLFSSSAIGSAKSALLLCARSLIPSLFPFFVCSNLLINLGTGRIFSKFFSPLMRPIFGLGGSCILPMLLGALSGYPVGAKTAADLYLDGSCSKSEAEKLLAFCNNCGPMFIIGAVGCGMLGSRQQGIILYISHLLSALAVALLMRHLPVTVLRKNSTFSQVSPSGGFGEIFSQAVSSSVLLTLNVCGFVILFSTVVSFADSLGFINSLASLGIDRDLSRSAVYSFFECSGGCDAVVRCAKSPLVRLMFLSSVIGWSGISVHLQVLGIIKKAKLSPKLYFKGKALMTIISPLFTFVIYSVYTGRLNSLPVFKTVVLFSAVIFISAKIFALCRRLYSRYAALPPR